MPPGLVRRQQTGQLHFITFSCYHRLPYLQHPEPKNTLEHVIENTHRSHNLTIYAYVLMPEHVHLLTNEPEYNTLASFLQVIKGESSKLLKATRETSIPKTGITKKINPKNVPNFQAPKTDRPLTSLTALLSTY